MRLFKKKPEIRNRMNLVNNEHLKNIKIISIFMIHFEISKTSFLSKSYRGVKKYFLANYLI